MFLKPSARRGAHPAWCRIGPGFGLFLLALMSLSIATPGYSQEDHATRSQRAGAEALTQSLAAQHARYRGADAAVRAQALGDLLEVAAERHEVLAALIEKDPAEVLRLALPEAKLDGMPAEVQEYLERRLELEGELEVLHVDYQDPAQSHYLYLLKTELGERFSLHFAHHPPGLLSGTKIRAHGLALFGAKARDAGETEGAVAVEDGETSVELLEAGGSGSTSGSGTATAALPNTLGAQKTLVILVNFPVTFPDKPTEPYTVPYAQDAVFGTTSNFFLENSFQQTWLSGDVVGWFTIPLDRTVCDSSMIATYGKEAAMAAGVDLSAYTRYLYAFPKNACGWWGLSGVGGNPSQAWVNGSLELGVAAHELGHGFGLWHSHLLDCGTTAVIGSNCTTNEYGDILDMMGASHSAHFNAFQKERLGWLNAGVSPPITTVQTNGTYTLETYELAGLGPKALKILKSTDPTTGAKTWYYVEARQAIGFDGFLANETTQNVLSGVLVHTGTEGNGNTSSLLDMTPATPVYYWWYDPALEAGQSFQDPDSGVTITTEWVTGTEAAVTVRFGPGSIGQPTVAISTDQPSYNRSQSVSMTGMVTAGGSPVANAAVSFTVTKSNGAVVLATATTGMNGAAVYKLRLRKQDPVGIYQAGALATTNGKSGSATTTFTVK